MFIDLGPVIILLFLDKGTCEFTLEQADLNERFRITTAAAAFQQIYPEIAQRIERGKLEEEMQGETQKMEIQHGKLVMIMQQKILDWYVEVNSIFDILCKKLDQEIDTLEARAAKTRNEDIKKMLAAYSKEMLRQFEETKNKMMLEFSNFIRSLNLFSPSTNQ
jgi:hypothetical protein